MRNRLSFSACFTLAALLTLAAPAMAQTPPSGAHAAGGPEAYGTFVKGATIEPGLIAIVKKKGKIYLALGTAQLGKDFIETSVPATGLGGFGPAQGEPYVAPARIIHFDRVGDEVVLRWPNSYTITNPNSPQAAGVRNSLPNSIIAVVPISAQDAGHVVIAADAFLGDVADLAASFAQLDKNPAHAYHLDRSRTFFTDAKAFPLNDVLRVDQTWVAAQPTKIDNAPDSRSIEVKMTYNLIAAPNDGYVPRIYDPRVGYFSEPLMNFATDSELQRTVQYITRWDFGRRTSAAPWRATKPIVFYLSDDIPAQYRETVRQALLTWNQAFARIGILGAVQVKNQPNTPGWDADDIRHNMIRWIDTSRPQFGAEALLVTDPRTGEELNVGVNFDAVEGMGGRLIYKYVIAPARGLPDSASAERSFTENFIRSVILHESGHDMGLQHNFIGSMAYTAKDLQSKAFTDKYGVASSVMEYSPTNLWPKGTPQGDYVQLVLGPYDYYAIKYGYGYVPGSTPQAQLPALRHWASRWADPYYRFASDEDAAAFASGHSIDPRVMMFDLTDKPLQWCRTQMTMMHGIMNAVNQRFPQSGMPYDEARAAFTFPLRADLRCATMAAHTIGGEYISRALKGDPGAKPPLRPVPLRLEREAWSSLRNGLFSDAAWRFNPQVLQTLTYSEDTSLDNGATWGYNPPPRHDVPVVTIVGAAQKATLNELFSPLRLERLDDMFTKYGNGRTMSLADLFTWARSGVFGDLASGGARDGLIRRNLQTMYAKLLAQMWIAPKTGTPADARGIARVELQNLRHAATLGAGRARGEIERGHLEALAAIARQALEARPTIAPTPGG